MEPNPLLECKTSLQKSTDVKRRMTCPLLQQELQRRGGEAAGVSHRTTSLGQKHGRDARDASTVIAPSLHAATQH